jgi:arylsulfatase A-like enzyme
VAPTLPPAPALTRRSFLAAGAAAAASALLPGCTGAPRRPDLLLLLTDDQHHRAIGYASGGRVRTPALDALARDGTIFENAYASALPCAPARGCLLTGRYRWAQAPNDVTLRLAPDEWTFARALRQAGYRTGLVGKMHMNPMRAEIGFEEALYSEHAMRRRVAAGEPREDDYERWLAGFGLEDWQNTRRVPARFRAQFADFERHHGAQVWPYEERLHPISWVRDRAVEFLDAHAGGAEPFCLVVSFRHPHGPFNPAERFLALYDPASVEIPRDRWTDMKDMPPRLRDQDKRGWFPRDAFPEAVLRRVFACYHALVTQIDDAIGGLLRHVDRGRTLVFYTSDHGEYLGHRGRIGKSPWTPFEDLARVPLFAAGAGVPAGRVVKAPVAHVDLAASFLHAAGSPAPAALNGIPLQRHFDEAAAPAPRTLHCHGNFLMTRRGPLKYFRRPDGSESMLFDLASDPGELVNLASHAERRAEIAELASEMDRVYGAPRRPSPG